MQLDLPLGSDWENKKAHIDAKIEAYEAGRTALTRLEVLKMHAERHEIIKSCPHETVELCTGTYTDSGYGCDRHWACKWVRCVCCGKVLWGTEGDGRTRVVGTMPLNAVFVSGPKTKNFGRSTYPTSDPKDLKVQF